MGTKITVTSSRSTRRRNVHPFPARMAPELALDPIARLAPGSSVLDPMCGSGTVLRAAIEAGHHAIGFDVDPLAVLLSRVACTDVAAEEVIALGESVVDTAKSDAIVSVPWIDDDSETLEFTKFWFGESQRSDLRALSSVIYGLGGPTADVLRVALSRTIVTKESAASLARDTSHSRPHRVALSSEYDVLAGFIKSCRSTAKLVDLSRPGTVNVRLGDARHLPIDLSSTVDLVVTSPPYLNAIDYLRGHRMSLVWLGHQMGQLREIRGTSVGSERGLRSEAAELSHVVPDYPDLPNREKAMLLRYGRDCIDYLAEVARVLVPGGEAVLVVGDSTLKGVFIENSSVVESAAAQAGLELQERSVRELPAGSRYLPPPTSATSSLSKRMKTEVVLRLAKPACE